MGEIGSESFNAVAPYYDHLMRWVPYERWADYVEELFARAGDVPSTVLDLCCGTGKFGLSLARRGYKVVGADLSYAMVREAQRNARAEQADLGTVAADARRLPFSLAFDAVVSVFDSLNYITEDGGLLAAFRSIAAALVPGGLLVFDVNTLTALEEELFTQSQTEESDPLQYRWVSSWDPEKRLTRVEMDFTWRDGECTRRFREVHVQRGYSREEITEWLMESGFRVLNVYNAYSFRRLTRSSTRAFYVARRLPSTG